MREGSNHELSQSNTTAAQGRHAVSKRCPADSATTSPEVLHKDSGPRDLQGSSGVSSGVITSLVAVFHAVGVAVGDDDGGVVQ